MQSATRQIVLITGLWTLLFFASKPFTCRIRLILTSRWMSQTFVSTFQSKAFLYCFRTKSIFDVFVLESDWQMRKKNKRLNFVSMSTTLMKISRLLYIQLSVLLCSICRHVIITRVNFLHGKYHKHTISSPLLLFLLHYQLRLISSLIGFWRCHLCLFVYLTPLHVWVPTWVCLPIKVHKTVYIMYTTSFSPLVTSVILPGWTVKGRIFFSISFPQFNPNYSIPRILLRK